MKKRGERSVSPLVKEAFLHLLPVQIIEIIVFSVNAFADSVITSRCLGTSCMAAIGLFNPIATVIGVTDVLIFGSQILCGRFIGSGKGNQVVSLFSTCVLFLSAVSLAMTAVCLIFRNALPALLGADPHLAPLVADYIMGYAPGIIGQVLTGMFMVFLPYNNDIRRCYLGIGVMIVSNILLDLLFVALWNIGVLGMGIATSLSYLLSCAVMLPGFINRGKAVYLRWKGFCFHRLPEAACLGLPSLMLILGCTARGIVMNRTLMAGAGEAAVAAMTVQSLVCAITGSVPLGSANAFLTMGSIYFGEENRRSLLDLLRFSLRIGVLISAACMMLMMLFSGPIASLFYASSAEAWAVTRRMLLIYPCFLIFNTVFSLLMKSHQLQNKNRLVNVLSAAEPLLMAFFSVALVGSIGTDAVWLSFPLSEVACLLVIAAAVWLHAGRLTLAPADWMMLDRDFGCGPDECIEFSVQSLDQVAGISRTVIDFCRQRQIDERRSILAGLSVEEMAGNAVVHGFRPGKKNHLTVRVVAKDHLTICVRDDCPAFDPKARLDQFHPEDITKNIGIRMIANLSEEMSYQGTGGINTLLIRI